MNPEVFEANPKVSIIISAYNVEKYLRQCLDSAINQTLKDIEIICVNDGSTDTSLEILKEYVRKDNRINLIDQKNEGAGLDAANGKYLHFLDGSSLLEYFDGKQLPNE